MPKEECSRVMGHAPRKALAVKKVSKTKPQKKHAKAAALTTALMARSTSPTPPSSPTYKMHKTLAAKKCAGTTTAPKKAAPTALEVFGSEVEVVSADEHVSATPTPPTPSSPHSPTYVRESWWDSFGELSRRIDETSKSVNDLKEHVKRLEEESEKNRAVGSVFGKRD